MMEKKPNENGKTFGASKDSDAEDPIKYSDEDKPSKVLRALTVSVYLFSVSFVAILLSLYYIFLWSKETLLFSRLLKKKNRDQKIESFRCLQT